MSDYTALIEDLKKSVPVYKDLLKKGASAKEQESFLKKITLKLPEGFMDFYAACNGGVPDESIDIQGMGFSSLKDILSAKKDFDEILEEKQEDEEFFCWHPDWIPFADDYSYDTLVIDTSGKATGRKGCILLQSKDTFEGDKICIIAADFDSFILDWVKRVKKGKVYSLKEKDEDGKNLLIEDGDHYYKAIAKVAFKG